MWDANSFVTLTYSDEELPPNGWLEPADLQRFFKRLRKACGRGGAAYHCPGGPRVRYFACGEYGSRTGRPHYHALLFNLGFRDRVAIGKNLWTSSSLERVWGHGNVSIGEVTGASAAYVAQYSLKKLGCDDDGVVRPAPFLRVSRNPSIGSAFVDRFASDLQHGYLVTGDRRGRIPRKYLDRLKAGDPSLAEEVEYRAFLRRLAVGPTDAAQPERLAAAEAIHKARKALGSRRQL